MSQIPRKATIYDIAKACGVSTATVSRALSNPNYPVSEKTRKLITDTARELRYVPNLLGRELKSRENRDIGIVIPNISNPYYSTLLQGVYDHAVRQGYTPLLFNSCRSAELESKNIAALMQKQVRGLIVVSISRNHAAVQGVLDRGYRVVVVEQDIDVDCLKVDFNFVKGAYLATRHLIENGHTRIGFIGAPLDRPSRYRMLDGYRQCMSEQGLPVRPEDIRLAEEEDDAGEIFEYRNGMTVAGEFCDMPERPTGYLCLNDMTALGAVKRFQEKGLSVPGDVSVIGFDNIPFSQLSTPALTTVDQSAWDMGALSAKILIESIESPVRNHFSVTLEPKLVERDTVRRISPANPI